MGIFRQFPYTNFHDMNLDWVLSKIKELIAEWTQFNTTWESWKNTVDEFMEWAQTLDLQEEVNNALQEMYDNGELLALVTDYLGFLTDSTRFTTELNLHPLFDLPTNHGWIEGGCYEAPYLLVCGHHSYDNVDLMIYNANYTLLKVHEGLALGHANSACSDGEYLYITQTFLPGTVDDRSPILFRIPLNEILEDNPTIDTITLPIVTDCVGYDKEKELFICDDNRTSEMDKIVTLDRDFNIVAEFDLQHTNPEYADINMCSISVYESYYIISWQNFTKGSTYTDSSICIYDSAFKCIRSLPVSEDYPFENEFATIRGDKLLIAQVESRYRILYTAELFATPEMVPSAYYGHRYVNENVLFNSFFDTTVINKYFNSQQTNEYVVTEGTNLYFIDGWFLYGEGTAKIENNYIELKASAGKNLAMSQFIPIGFLPPNTDIVFNVEFDSNYAPPRLVFGTGKWNHEHDKSFAGDPFGGYTNWRIVSPSYGTESYYNARIRADNGQTVRVKSAKIERGRFSTLQFNKASGVIKDLAIKDTYVYNRNATVTFQYVNTNCWIYNNRLYIPNVPGSPFWNPTISGRFRVDGASGVIADNLDFSSISYHSNHLVMSIPLTASDENAVRLIAVEADCKFIAYPVTLT